MTWSSDLTSSPTWLDEWELNDTDYETLIYKICRMVLSYGNWIECVFDECLPNWRDRRPNLELHYEEMEYPELVEEIFENPECRTFVEQQYGIGFLSGIQFAARFFDSPHLEDMGRDAFASALRTLMPVAEQLSSELEGSLLAIVAMLVENSNYDCTEALLRPEAAEGAVVPRGERLRGLTLLMHDFLQRGYFTGDRTDFWHEISDCIQEVADKVTHGEFDLQYSPPYFSKPEMAALRALELQQHLLKQQWVRFNDRFMGLGALIDRSRGPGQLLQLCEIDSSQALRFLDSVAKVARALRQQCYAEGNDPGSYDDFFTNYHLGEWVGWTCSQLIEDGGEYDRAAAVDLFRNLVWLRHESLTRDMGPGDWLDRLNGGILSLAAAVPEVRKLLLADSGLLQDAWFDRDSVQALISNWTSSS